MKKKLPSYYWDSSIYLMVLKGETCHGDGVLEAAIEILRRVEKQEAVIVSSSLVLVEILPSKSPPDAYDRFQAWTQWHNMFIHEADLRICTRAAELRDRGYQAKPIIKLATSDAVHLATAIAYKDDIHEIHSVDGDFWRGLGLSGESIQVVKPRMDQLLLPIVTGDDDEENA